MRFRNAFKAAFTGVISYLMPDKIQRRSSHGQVQATAPIRFILLLQQLYVLILPYRILSVTAVRKGNQLTRPHSVLDILAKLAEIVACLSTGTLTPGRSQHNG